MVFTLLISCKSHMITDPVTYHTTKYNVGKVSVEAHSFWQKMPISNVETNFILKFNNAKGMAAMFVTKDNYTDSLAQYVNDIVDSTANLNGTIKANYQLSINDKASRYLILSIDSVELQIAIILRDNYIYAITCGGIEDKAPVWYYHCKKSIESFKID